MLQHGLCPPRIYIWSLWFTQWFRIRLFKDGAFKREMNLLRRWGGYRDPKSTLTLTHILIRQRSLDVWRHPQCAHTEQRPCKETGRRQASVSQEKSFRRDQLTNTWILAFQPLQLWKIDSLMTSSLQYFIAAALTDECERLVVICCLRPWS